MFNDLWPLWSYCVVLLLGIACYFLSGWFRIIRFVLQLSGPPAVPLLGNAPLITNQQRLLELGKTAYKEYGPVFRAWVTVIPTVVILAPEHVQVILSSCKYTEKICFYKLLHSFLGQGLVTSSGEQWRHHRRLIQPSFHLSILEGFIETFYDSAQLLVAKLSTEADLSSINITAPINQCVLNILHEAVLGIPMATKTTDILDSPFRQGKVVAPYRLLHPWLLLDLIYRLTDVAKHELQQQKNINDFTRKILNERCRGKQAQDPLPGCMGKPGKKSFLDLMIQVTKEHESFSEEDAIHELCTFMLAGQDSVGSALAFSLFELARHPHVQELAVQELYDVFGDDQRVPSLSDLGRLTYLDQCIKETLRMYPSVPLIFRTLTQDAKLGQYTVPAGCGILISPFATHHLPGIYPEPEKFDPDRFLPDKVESRHPYAFIPFSAGPRNCIGYRFALMEMKTIISTILRRYRLSTVVGHENLRLMYRITIRASGGIWLCLTPRVQSSYH
ncbi:probable cytochrome P450 4aa1 isoform X2 [Zootermopsis nevadensis]|uniref:probable cytochrome P450 4aa1 isoform X2 n=1 Tax=Zootermopsis nevadensis TaxID=136037 RepID=UPI000B8E5526|nr:probable cytochrome P450 4aa1 isoform X2 [Zootermopsis nevadensis]